MRNHINEFSKIILGLESMKVEVGNVDKAILLLNSLPKSYKHLSTTLLYGNEKVTYDGVTASTPKKEFFTLHMRQFVTVNDRIKFVTINDRDKTHFYS